MAFMKITYEAPTNRIKTVQYEGYINEAGIECTGMLTPESRYFKQIFVRLAWQMQHTERLEWHTGFEFDNDDRFESWTEIRNPSYPHERLDTWNKRIIKQIEEGFTDA